VDKPRKAAYLGRVSSQQQSKADRQGLPEQRRAAYAYAESNGLEVTADFEDIISGASESRPAFYELLARAREFSVVIVAHTDRIARDTEIGLRHMRLIREAGLELHSAARGVVETGLASGVEMLLSEEERKNIYRRTTSARIAIARAGQLPNAMQAFGYTNVKREAVLIPHEVELVYRMFEMCASGLGFIHVARTLQAEGVLTPRAQRGERSDTVWSPQTVARIIKNPIYKGEYVWRHTGEEYHLAVPPVVSPELWAAAQKDRRGPASRLNFPLSGHLFCGICGARLSSRRHERQRWPNGNMHVFEFYRCNNATMARFRSTCTLKQFTRGRIEPPIDAELRRIMTDPETMRHYLAAEQPPDPAKETERAHLQREDGRWLEAFQAGAIDAAELGEYRREIRGKLRGLETADGEPGELPVAAYQEAAQTMTLAELVEFANVSITILPKSLHFRFGERRT
jgi:site-specific DNA recombinase